ncbi:DUF2474 domain-containing protein [Gallaecimonas kandeliae]|nr:DUF2474 domain-containing protein [Gallaecimonas kandeliae]WKE65223.1 DUF2474 domain-containing protein [Gallaecimonas kandeliae]
MVKKGLWFVGLYLGGLLALSVVAFGLRWLLH